MATDSTVRTRDVSSPAAQINALVDRFVAGQPFWDFHRAFMAFYESFDESVLPEMQRDLYWGLYDLVYMGQPDPVAPENARVGLLGESALRERLRHFLLQEPGAAAT